MKPKEATGAKLPKLPGEARRGRLPAGCGEEVTGTAKEATGTSYPDSPDLVNSAPHPRRVPTDFRPADPYAARYDHRCWSIQMRQGSCQAATARAASARAKVVGAASTDPGADAAVSAGSASLAP